jgi:hypothetical protein
MRRAMIELEWMEAHHISFDHDVTSDLEVHPDYGLRVDREATLRNRQHAQDKRNAEARVAAAQPVVTE